MAVVEPGRGARPNRSPYISAGAAPVGSAAAARGLFFLSPLRIEAGTLIELEVKLIAQPVARATVRMSATAHVVRTETAEKPGWYAVAAAFDDISYRRDENFVE